MVHQKKGSHMLHQKKDEGKSYARLAVEVGVCIPGSPNTSIAINRKGIVGRFAWH